VLEEIGSLVVVLRLWRVFKIIEELSAGAEESMEPLQERLEETEKENRELKKEIQELKQRHSEEDV
jgi:voltage-gated hydrogen channel 1